MPRWAAQQPQRCWPLDAVKDSCSYLDRVMTELPCLGGHAEATALHRPWKASQSPMCAASPVWRPGEAAPCIYNGDLHPQL